HGGNFNAGGTSMEVFNGANLIDQAVDIDEPVIVISLNYRLGSFGFLASPEILELGGSNAGMKDQQFALLWVRKYIAAFGGDPAKITVFGESAGADSIGVHLISTKTDLPAPLFDAAILQSAGVDFGPVANWSSVYASTYTPIAAALNCSSFECVRDTPAEDLLAVQLSTNFNYRPYIDHSYIEKDTAVLLRDGEFMSVPILLGSNTDEGTIFSSNVSADIYDAAVGATFAGLPAEDIETILDLYPVEAYANTSFGASDAGFLALADIIGDFYLQCPVQSVADAYSSHSTALDSDDLTPIVYRYFFTHLPAYEVAAGYALFGVFHSIEIPYVFADFDRISTSPDEMAIARSVVGAWTRFARTLSTPNGWTGQVAPDWPKYVRDASLPVGGGLQLVINGGSAGDFSVAADTARSDKCAFWNNIQVLVSST
ncbi:hypothetical protein HK405_007485, partial [Cladochytrium tenue]